MHMMKADVMVDIHARNNHIAEHVHEHLAEHKIFAVNIMGAPGAGKTTTLENLLKHLDVPGYVIEGDIEADIDTERLRKQNIAATQINTFGACHLDAPLVHNAIHALPLTSPVFCLLKTWAIWFVRRSFLSAKISSCCRSA